jgi:hypothetical protein
MRSQDRKRFTQQAYGNEERASRVSGARTRDTGASESFSDVTRGTGGREEVEEDRYRASSAFEERSDTRSPERIEAMPNEASEGAWAPEPNIVPEHERSQR